MTDYVTSTDIRKLCNISAGSLRLWGDQGQIRIIRTPGGKRLYHKTDVFNILGLPLPIPVQKGIIYTRRSPTEDKTIMEHQIVTLREQYPQYELITDSGSGINYNRPGLKKLLQQVSTGTISEVVVTHRHQLCRYGIELIEYIFQLHNTKLVVLGEESPIEREEFVDDIFEMCQYFMSKYNNKRGNKGRQHTNHKNKIVSTQGSQTEIESGISSSQIHLQQMREPLFVIEGDSKS